MNACGAYHVCAVSMCVCKSAQSGTCILDRDACASRTQVSHLGALQWGQEVEPRAFEGTIHVRLPVKLLFVLRGCSYAYNHIIGVILCSLRHAITHVIINVFNLRKDERADRSTTCTCRAIFPGPTFL